MRTTLTLDDDVAAKLKAEARKSGRPFRQVVNDSLRRGLLVKRDAQAAGPFKIEPRDLGGLRPGISLDCIARLLDEVEGPDHR
jgi:hypothetical protein